MEEIDQLNLEFKSSEPETHASKKRRIGERVVVAVKIEENDKRQQRNEGPPSDCWSWRKYGQKPIKGSPYPRGYYRCSTSKGCSAKKQVERCKTDATMLIITYTSTHNHPGPDHFSPPNNHKQDQKEINQATTPKQEQEQEQELMIPQEIPVKDNFQYSQSPFNSTPDHITVNQEDNPFQENLQTPGVLDIPKPFSHDSVKFSSLLKKTEANDLSPFNSTPDHTTVNQEDNPFQEILQTPGVLDISKPFSHDSVKFSSLLEKTEENDFYDELEELPTSSFFTSFMRSGFCEDRIVVNPS
ncbi:hypothetical protein DH2020_048098 [Rehmannia glutinosa]|uniref:WRKY domain-containing protein n=1 Tax=Rehmannia glutinosa TaxID=99300 RepID=A0ABR0U6K7_REHGL